MYARKDYVLFPLVSSNNFTYEMMCYPVAFTSPAFLTSITQVEYSVLGNCM